MAAPGGSDAIRSDVLSVAAVFPLGDAAGGVAGTAAGTALAGGPAGSGVVVAVRCVAAGVAPVEDGVCRFRIGTAMAASATRPAAIDAGTTQRLLPHVDSAPKAAGLGGGGGTAAGVARAPEGDTDMGVPKGVARAPTGVGIAGFLPGVTTVWRSLAFNVRRTSCSSRESSAAVGYRSSRLRSSARRTIATSRC